MAKLFKLNLLLFCLLIGVNILVAQTKKSKTSIKTQQFEIGTIEDQIYTNKYFNLQLSLPQHWQIQEQIIGNIIKDLGTKSMKGKTAATQKAINQQINKVSIAFTLFKDVAGTPDNASFILVFEDMRSVPAVKNGVDYLQLAINTYRSMKLPPGFKFSPNIKTETLGNTKLVFMETLNGITKQRMYATVSKGFGILFTLSYTNEEDLNSMREIINGTNFNYTGK